MAFELLPEHISAPSPPLCRCIHVNRLSNRYKVTYCMMTTTETKGEAKIISKTVYAFQSCFKGNFKANLQKASRWWRMRSDTMSLKDADRRGILTADSSAHGAMKLAHLKFVEGRGRKSAGWVKVLYGDLRVEWEWLRLAGVKFMASVLHVVYGGEPITTMVRLIGGGSAFMKPPMLIFKNGTRSSPVRGVPDNIPGVCYRICPKGWMNKSIWHAWLREPRALKSLPYGEQRVLYVENCPSHNTGPTVNDILRKIRTKLQKLPQNATYLVQSA